MQTITKKVTKLQIHRRHLLHVLLQQKIRFDMDSTNSDGSQMETFSQHCFMGDKWDDGLTLRLVESQDSADDNVLHHL